MALQNVMAVDHGKVVGAISNPAVNIFSIATTDWEANAGTDATDFPYVCSISSTLYSNTFVPAEVLLLGADTSDYPSSSEASAIGLVDRYVKFTASGIRLRATAAPASALTLVVRG